MDGRMDKHHEQHEHYEVTVANRTGHPLELTARSVSGGFDRAPETGHVLAPGETDTFDVGTDRRPGESGAASFSYRMTDAPVTLTAAAGPPETAWPSGTLRGARGEDYACTVDRDARAGRSFIAVERAKSRIPLMGI
ncbi:hypothetical protein I5Q34_21135 [Streptomyces sp. AV19]|uniref:hypothetical protein n=1 Tax=Streptomyces sp. AV19 TaxID=2793068 RepID=UPI0018FE4BDC|nr:hypothetical protein [Streptomyces sp. AV19]MBH1936751.1 hypothetical protein [Streptomyces sp. AV19]MDG4532811.1 hypothetical protein [Streptomyces sp. AV19]